VSDDRTDEELADAIDRHAPDEENQQALMDAVDELARREAEK
jgi:UDP-N-acetylglucosamine:LPS N-acetylglucosamine transferase